MRKLISTALVLLLCGQGGTAFAGKKDADDEMRPAKRVTIHNARSELNKFSSKKQTDRVNKSLKAAGVENEGRK